MSDACPNCGAALVGRWCHACGQKRIEPEERTVRWFLGEFVAGLTNLDSRFMRSAGALLVTPGRLSAEWIAGRRARWMAPITLFLIVNVAYFFAPQLTDLNLPLRDQVRQWYGAHAGALVETRLAARGLTFEAYAAIFEREALSLAKTLIVLHVPPFALALMLLAWDRRLLYVDHLVTSLHVWTALLFAILAIPLLLEGAVWLVGAAGAPLGPAGRSWLLKGALALTAVAFLYHTLRGAYGLSRIRAALLTPLTMLVGALTHFAYRAVLFYVVFAVT